MKIKYLFPIILILCNVGAGVVSIFVKDYKKAIYWIAAAVLNAAVTF